jgi:hypothetical protein
MEKGLGHEQASRGGPDHIVKHVYFFVDGFTRQREKRGEHEGRKERKGRTRTSSMSQSTMKCG